MIRLEESQWRALEAEHEARADAATAAHRARRASGRKHAIEDFLYDYYGLRPSHLRRWHPGAGVLLAGAATEPRASWRWYRSESDDVDLDLRAYLAERGEAVRYVHDLLTATAARSAALGCFGLHEWAMVYREAAGEHRHPLPLRLGEKATDAVVEEHTIRCSHFDAFRFFTPEARGRNVLTPTRATQVAMEQPGCLHATMDLLKWALKLGPLVPGGILLDTFDLARDVRVLDMRASPYDVTSLGHSPVPIETPEGRAEYVRAQRAFAARGQALRERLIDVCEAAPAAA